jgi:hypothetical protein
MTVTQARLRERLDYDVTSGVFIWKPANHPGWKHSLEGTIAGRINTNGHVQITIDGETYLAHVLVWFWMKGEWPDNQVDHKNRDKKNNRWGNLREATNGQNRANSKSSAASGMKGVYPNGKRWASVIRHNKKGHYLGTFDTKDQAYQAYTKAALTFHKEFARAT